MSQCGAKTRSDGPCGRLAMPNGRCDMHGGKSPGGPIKHGRYSLVHRAGLAEKAERFLNDPAPGDLSAELALIRALLQDYLERFGEGQALRAEDIAFLGGMVEQIGRTVERISRMLNASALTQVEVQYLQARLADLLVTYVPDPDARRRFLDELRPPRPLAGRGLGPDRDREPAG